MFEANGDGRRLIYRYDQEYSIHPSRLGRDRRCPGIVRNAPVRAGGDDAPAGRARNGADRAS